MSVQTFWAFLVFSKNSYQQLVINDKLLSFSLFSDPMMNTVFSLAVLCSLPWLPLLRHNFLISNRWKSDVRQTFSIWFWILHIPGVFERWPIDFLETMEKYNKEKGLEDDQRMTRFWLNLTSRNLFSLNKLKNLVHPQVVQLYWQFVNVISSSVSEKNTGTGLQAYDMLKSAVCKGEKRPFSLKLDHLHIWLQWPWMTIRKCEDSNGKEWNALVWGFRS